MGAHWQGFATKIVDEARNLQGIRSKATDRQKVALIAKAAGPAIDEPNKSSAGSGS